MSRRIARLMPVAFLACAACAPRSSTMPVRMAYSGWVPYMNSDRSIRGFTTNASSLSEAMVFGYDFGADGGLKPAQNTLDVLAAARAVSKRPARLFITIVNDTESGDRLIQKDGAMTHRVLSDPRSRQKLVEQIGRIVEPVDGIDVDFENMDYGDKNDFTSFIVALAQALHERGKLLSLTVQPKSQDMPLDDSGKPRTSAALDWPALSRYADTFRIMAYFYHWRTSPPGAIASPKDVSDLARFALASVPKEKLCIALCFWGFDWPEGRAGSEIDFARAQALAAAHKAVIQRDPETRYLHYRYKVGNVEHEVWFDDAESVHAKLQVLREAGISKVAFWEMSTGDPKLWNDLAARSIK